MMKSSLRSVIAAVALLHLSISTTNAFAPTRTTKGAFPANSFRQQRHAKIDRREPQAWKIASRFSAVGPLEASPLLIGLASSSAGALLVLAGIVLVHESGHYLAARSFGIEVEEFSIGFGPKLLGFEAFGNEFNLRAVPLGGYVRFPENYNTTLAQEQEREAFLAAKEEKKRRNTSTGQEFVNAITFGLLEQQRRKSEEAQRLRDAERDAEEQKKLPFWSKFNLGAKKENEGASTLTTDPEDDIEIEYYDNPNLLQNRSWQQRAVVLSGGVIFNILLSFSIYFGQIGFGSGLPRPLFESGVVVNAAPRPDGPANGILRKGDVIISANGAPITLSESPTAFEAQKAISKFIAIIRATPDGEAINLSVLHKNDAKPVELSIRPLPTQMPTGSVGPKSIGIFLTPNFVKSEVLRSDSLPEAARLAYDYAVEVTSQTANGLLSVAGESLSGKNGAAGQQVSGPIGLIKTGSDIVATKDLTTVLLFAAAISINLAVVNSLPLPGLDGGQLVFVLAEAVMGRKIDQQLQEGITGVTVLLLLLTSVGTAFGDVQALFMR
jgi:membrane-associated protease RseP (regulator of RpoE activity)